MMPPAPSCQPAYPTGEIPSGLPHFLVSTMPVAMQAAPMSPATMPTGSNTAPGPRTTRPTPTMPTTPHVSRHADRRSESMATLSRTTMSGWHAPRVAATPPGSRSAAVNSSGK
jgi:hypothetical protein